VIIIIEGNYITSMGIVHGDHENSMEARAKKGGARIQIGIARDLSHETLMICFTRESLI